MNGRITAKTRRYILKSKLKLFLKQDVQLKTNCERTNLSFLETCYTLICFTSIAHIYNICVRKRTIFGSQ